MESAGPRPASGRRRSPRRPERQQIVIRRALALGAGLLVLILIVLGVKGCLNARKERALSDYANNVTQIVQETQQTSKNFFAKLDDPGDLTVTDFVDQVNADRSAMDSYQSRVDGLDAPGDMGHAQSSLELVYDLRASAMNEIADQARNALGDVGTEKAMAKIAKQMELLLAGDVLYASVVRPEINRVLTDNSLESDAVPKSVFLPEGTKWIDEDTISSALGGVSGAETTSDASGIHGMGLLGTSINGTELVADTTTAVAVEETPEVEVVVGNQGESAENGVTVSVSVAGGGTFDQTVDSIEPGEEQTVVVPLVPAPNGTVDLEVEVDAVPGEEITTNNEASYTVEFE